jgi:putative isomerase
LRIQRNKSFLVLFFKKEHSSFEDAMLRNTTIQPERAWNTWSAHPLEMVFLPLGVRVTPLAYSGSTGKATLFPSGPHLRFGRHTLDGSVVEAEVEHAGTRLSWRYQKADPYRIAGGWNSLAHGEWGLRFWINICLSAECGTGAGFDPASGAAVIKIGQRFAALFSAAPPVQVTGHPTIEAAIEDYETNGYFDTRTRSLSAPVIMLRFNLEMMRDCDFGVAVADDRSLAIEAARAAAHMEQAAPSLESQTGKYAGSLDAVRDVMAWNTVWDEVNDRPYTSISRNWNLAKFGGYGVWLNDQLFHTLMTSALDPGVARENLATALASATPQGNLACLLTARDAWVDRTQPPIGGFILWLLHLRLRSREMLEQAYATLARNHAWWWQNRDPDGSGLCSYGTSDVGEGLYQGTAFGARNESCQDNAPVHDEAVYDPRTRCLTTIDVGLNSLLSLDAEMLSLIAGELGKTDEAARHTQISERTRKLVRETLWDEQRGIFANRLRSGAFVRSVSPTSFYPLVAGIATDGQVEFLLGHLEDPSMFGGNFIIPSVSRDDPAYHDNTYWRGRVWPPLNYLVWHGLRRNGRYELASRLAEASLELFSRSWEANRLCPENYNAETGEALDQPDTEGFYGWGALMPLMGVAELCDFSPWDGWSVTNTGVDWLLRQIETPLGRADIGVVDGRLTLWDGGRMVFETALQGRFEHIVWERSGIGMRVPPSGDAGGEILFPAIALMHVAHAMIDGEAIVVSSSGSGVVVALPPSAVYRRLNLYLR